MDPLTGAIVAAVLFLVSIPIAFVVATFLLGLLGMAIGGEAGGGIGAVVGWIAGAGWAVFALIQLVLQVIRIVQIATGAA